jgi:hypothetical protein
MKMRANFDEEWFDIMDEKIYLDLEVHVMNNKLVQAEKENKTGFAEFLNKVVSELNVKLADVNNQLRELNIKISPVERLDDMFVEYYYSCKINGGFKEGTLRYWDAAIKMKLGKRVNAHFD